VSFDVNYRSALWSADEARQFAESILPHVRYLFLGQTEAETVFRQTGSPEQLIKFLSGLAPKATIALLQGAEGSTVYDSGRIWRPAVNHAVHVVDPIGAGDAYIAGYLWAALRGRSVQESVDSATATGSLKCSIWGDFALISEREVLETLAGSVDVKR
jgi:2-dehydro-3-deoxygluconokinase